MISGAEPAAARSLVLMAKEPRAGMTKTRLARDLGQDASDRLYRAFLRDLAGELASTSWRCRLARADEAEAPILSSIFGPPWSFVHQGAGDLGQRLSRCAGEALAEGAPAVVLCGSDAPTLTAADVSLAFDALASADIVIAPAPDGGYSLIGLSRCFQKPPGSIEGLFADVRWSSPHARSDTLRAAGKAGLRTCLIHSIPDVDVAEDLEALERELSARPGVAPATRLALQALRAGELLAKVPGPASAERA